MGSRRELRSLRARVQELEGQVAVLVEQLDAARPLLDDSRRVQELSERIAGVAAGADTALKLLGERAARTGLAQARFRPKVGVTYRAQVSGYVTAHYVGGRNDVLSLLVGREDPPTECVCTADCRHGINSYLAGVIRAGEYWMITYRHSAECGFATMFTPLC